MTRMPVFEQSSRGIPTFPVEEMHVRPAGAARGRVSSGLGDLAAQCQHASHLRTRFTAAKERLMPATEPEQHWTIALRCQPAGPGTSKPENPSSRTYEIICRICGDDPALDHQQMSAELQQIRGPYTLSDGIAAFARHNESHNGTGEMQR